MMDDTETVDVYNENDVETREDAEHNPFAEAFENALAEMGGVDDGEVVAGEEELTKPNAVKRRRRRLIIEDEDDDDGEVVVVKNKKKKRAASDDLTLLTRSLLNGHGEGTSAPKNGAKW